MCDRTETDFNHDRSEMEMTVTGRFSSYVVYMYKDEQIDTELCKESIALEDCIKDILELAWEEFNPDDLTDRRIYGQSYVVYNVDDEPEVVFTTAYRQISKELAPALVFFSAKVSAYYIFYKDASEPTTEAIIKHLIPDYKS